MKVCCVGYRDWALDIYSSIEQEFETLIIKDKNKRLKQEIFDYQGDLSREPFFKKLFKLANL